MFRHSKAGPMLPASQNLWLERRQLAHPCSPANCPGMALPVLVGPNRCELIYNHRVCFPVVELLKALSQLAPPSRGSCYEAS